MLFGFFINVNHDPSKHIWFLQTHILMFDFIVITELVRIVMEKRYAKNKNDYIFTAVQLGVISLFLLQCFRQTFWLIGLVVSACFTKVAYISTVVLLKGY